MYNTIAGIYTYIQSYCPNGASWKSLSAKSATIIRNLRQMCVVNHTGAFKRNGNLASGWLLGISPTGKLFLRIVSSKH